MNYLALKNDILTGPHAVECAPYLTTSHVKIAEILNGKPSSPMVYERANIEELSRYMLDQGLWPDIEDNITSGVPAVKKASRQFMHAQKLASAVGTLDVHAVGAQAAFDALVTNGVMTAQQRSVIEAMGRLKSHTESTYGRTLSHQDITEALKA